MALSCCIKAIPIGLKSKGFHLTSPHITSHGTSNFHLNSANSWCAFNCGNSRLGTPCWSSAERAPCSGFASLGNADPAANRCDVDPAMAGAFLSHRGSPSCHPFISIYGIFHELNQLLGIPHFSELETPISNGHPTMGVSGWIHEHNWDQLDTGAAMEDWNSTP